MSWEKVTLIGVGLLGGSLGQALRKRSLANSVVGLVRREESITEAVACQAVDHATLNPAEAVQDADLVVLCTPLGRMASLTATCVPFLRKDVILTDVGSAKRRVTDEMTAALRDHSGVYLGSHPMAGKEKSGVAAACPDLFDGAACVVTPETSTPDHVLERLCQLWEAVGCQVHKMAPSDHDKLVSRVSHLPHVLSSLLASYVLDPREDSRQRLLCASGFRDTTRIAAGDVTMWRDILEQNPEAVTSAIDDFVELLSTFRNQIRQGDFQAISETLEVAAKRRIEWGKGAAVIGGEA